MMENSSKPDNPFLAVHRASRKHRVVGAVVASVGLLSVAGIVSAAGAIAGPNTNSPSSQEYVESCSTYEDSINALVSGLDPTDHPSAHKYRTLGADGGYIEDGPTPGPVMLAHTYERVADLKARQAAAIARGDACIGYIQQLPVSK